MRTRVQRSIYATLSLVAILLVTSVPAWGASEGKPFEITKFTMQTTGPTVITPVNGGQQTEEGYVLNNPLEQITQAGGHPWALTTKVEFATEELEFYNGDKREPQLVPTRDPK